MRTGAIELVVVLTVLVAAYTDIRWGKIYNWLTLPAIVLGWVLNFAFDGLPGLGTSLAGFALAFGIGFVLFNLKALTGGDVKLIAAIGALMGVKFAVAMLLYTGLAGGVLGFWWSARHGSLKATAGRFRQMVRVLVVPGMVLEKPLHESDSPPMPYGLAIAAGTLLRLAFPEWLPL